MAVQVGPMAGVHNPCRSIDGPFSLTSTVIVRWPRVSSSGTSRLKYVAPKTKNSALSQNHEARSKDAREPLLAKWPTRYLRALLVNQQTGVDHVGIHGEEHTCVMCTHKSKICHWGKLQGSTN